MFSWLSNLFMGLTADAALESAIYSVGVASNFGMHQIKAPETLQALATESEK